MLTALPGWAEISDTREGYLWTALLEAARVLGLERMLPRLVASRLPRDAPPWGEGVRVEGGLAKILVPHACPHDCTLVPDQCLTALLIEAKVGIMQGLPLQVQHITPAAEGMISVALGPLVATGSLAEPDLGDPPFNG